MSHEHCDSHGHCDIHGRNHHHGSQNHCCCCEAEAGGHHHHKHEDFSRELIDLADEAWMDVLYDKIKEQVLATSGSQLEKLAKIVTEANKDRWKNKLGANKANHELKEKVSEFFNRDS